MSLKKQKGATLFTALVFLTLMTIVGVSAAKISIMDLLVAGHNQQKMVLAQDTANDLKVFVKSATLIEAMIDKSFNPDTGVYRLTADEENILEKQIIDIGFDKEIKLYDCDGVNGLAMSLGPTARKCDLFNFQVKRHLQNSSAKDQHDRGVGKEVPNPSPSEFSAL